MPISEVYNMDCMEYMKNIPDKFFDLAIVDPQYGIDIMHKGGMPKHLGFKQYKRKDWDKSPPERNILRNYSGYRRIKQFLVVTTLLPIFLPKWGGLFGIKDNMD